MNQRRDDRWRPAARIFAAFVLLMLVCSVIAAATVARPERYATPEFWFATELLLALFMGLGLLGAAVAFGGGGRHVGGYFGADLQCDLAGEQGRRLMAATVEDLRDRDPNLRLEKQSPDEARLYHPTAYGYGERLVLRIEGDCVRAVSRSSFPLGVLDWGRNYRNIQVVHRSFDRAVEALRT